MIEILKAITRSGLASFLAVIKFFGDMPSLGMMSFPQPGIMLALDFPIRPEVSFDLLDRLARITPEHRRTHVSGQRCVHERGAFQTFYPQWQEFARYIDPSFSSGFWQRVTGRGLSMSKDKSFPSRVLVLGATSAIAEATLRQLRERGVTFLSGGAQP